MRWLGVPSPSNGALARPSGWSASSTRPKASPATRSPSRAANSDLPFCTASAVSAELSTPRNDAATNGSSTTVAFIDGHLRAPSRSTARCAASRPQASGVELGEVAADRERDAGLDLAVLLREHVGEHVGVVLAVAAAYAGELARKTSPSPSA